MSEPDLTVPAAGTPGADGRGALPLVRRETVDGISTITLDSPRNRNALSARLRAELAAHLAAAAADGATRVVVLTHTGPVFCSGMDLTEARTSAPDGPGVLEFPAVLQAIWESPKPVVARLAGPARAGGVGLVAACDIAVAVDTATFAFSEVRIGVIPAVISAVVRPRMLPRAVHELFLTGEVFDAARATATGLISAAVPVDRLDEEVARYTGMLRLGAPGALAATKQLLARPPADDLAESLADLVRRSAAFFASQEAAEGMRAFGEKRRPNWA
jgi:methylglutaconyl-CoA hydratase